MVLISRAPVCCFALTHDFLLHETECKSTDDADVTHAKEEAAWAVLSQLNPSSAVVVEVPDDIREAVKTTRTSDDVTDQVCMLLRGKTFTFVSGMVNFFFAMITQQALRS
jgi:hypothetical protein